MRTQKNVEIKQLENEINKSQSNEINSDLLKYLDILDEFGFDFCAHRTLQFVVSSKQYGLMSKIIELSKIRGEQYATQLLNESGGVEDDGTSPIMTAFETRDAVAMKTLLRCDEQDCNELFTQILITLTVKNRGSV